jgi:toluene monooxygenase system ferredoxin subunit
MMPFSRVAALVDLWSGEMRRYVVQGKKILLVRMDDTIYAYEDRCAHQSVMLSKGSLSGSVVTCSAHQWQYDVRTGAGVNPASARLTSVPVKVEGDAIFVDVSEVGR